MNELEPMIAIVAANSDNFGPTVDLHEKLAKHLPAFTRMIVLAAEGALVPPKATAHHTPVDAPWARDFAPTFVRTRDGKIEAVEFNYQRARADGAAAEFAKAIGVPLRSVDLKLEGGNLLADNGRLFLTDAVIARNPERSKAEIEAHVDSIEWFERLPQEPTAHIDMFARLIGPNTMLVSDSMNPNQKPVLDRAAKRFEALGYSVVRVTNPAFAPRDPEEDTGWGPTLSYANALIVNGTAFVPQYENALYRTLSGDLVKKHDAAALEAYRQAGFKTVAVPADQLILFQGSVHCMTNTIPAGIDLSKAFPAA